MRSKFHLSRRSFLRGTGATLGLPLLEIMNPSVANASNKLATGAEGQTVRFACLYMPHGRPPGSWDINGSNLDNLPRVLKPLEAHKEYLTVFQNMESPKGAHNRGLPGFLTGSQTFRTSDAAKANVNNPTIDQIIGNAHNKAFPLPTLELGMHSPQPGLGMEGSSNIYSTFLSWKNAKTPVPFELNPQRAFDRLFKNAGVSTRKLKGTGSRGPNQSVIDDVLLDAKGLQRKLGVADQRKLDEYLTAVREVEIKLQNQVSSESRLNILPNMLSDIKATKSKIKSSIDSQQASLGAVPKLGFEKYIQLMMDVMALAFWSNSTISSTLMFGNGGAGRNMSFLNGVKSNQHRMTHHKGDPKLIEMYTIVNTFFASQVGYFLERLRSMEEGGSNVLENSIVLFGSNTGDGNGHTKTKIPLLVAGKGGGTIKGNQNIDGQKKQLSCVHNSILDKMGINETVGVDTSKLRGF